MIEARVGGTIAELFEREGEARFRTLERETLSGLLAGPSGDSAEGPAVIATGGGIVLAAENRALLSHAATTVYLQTSPAALVARVRHDTRRPLLRGDDVLTRLQQLHAEREPLYRQVASLVVEAEGSTVPRLAARIAAELGLVAAPG